MRYDYARLGEVAEVHLLIGARAKAYPLQIIDFVTGILGWDMLGDDVKPYDPWKAK